MTFRVEVLRTTHVLSCAFGGGTFSGADAQAAGITRQQLRSAVRAGAVHHLRRGTYSLCSGHLARACLAVRDLHDRGVLAAIGARTAGDLWGVGAFGSRGPLSESLPTVLMGRDGPMREGERYGVRFRVADLRAEQLTVLVPPGLADIGEAAITTPLRTALDVSREQGRCRISALTPLSLGLRAEFAWRGGWLTPGIPLQARAVHDVTDALQEEGLRRELLSDLRSVMHVVNGYGMYWTWKVLPDVEPRLETVLEVVAWGRLTATDLPRPVPQATVFGASGRAYRADFLIGGRVIVEVDRSGKYSQTTPWEEKQRQSDLEAAGYWVVRCTWDELIHRPGHVVRRICLALERSAA